MHMICLPGEHRVEYSLGLPILPPQRQCFGDQRVRTHVAGGEGVLRLQARKAGGSALNTRPILVPLMQADEGFPRSGIIRLAARLRFEKSHGIVPLASSNEDPRLEQVREGFPRMSLKKRVDLPIR